MLFHILNKIFTVHHLPDISYQLMHGMRLPCFAVGRALEDRCCLPPPSPTFSYNISLFCYFQNLIHCSLQPSTDPLHVHALILLSLAKCKAPLRQDAGNVVQWTLLKPHRTHPLNLSSERTNKQTISQTNISVFLIVNLKVEKETPIFNAIFRTFEHGCPYIIPCMKCYNFCSRMI